MNLAREIRRRAADVAGPTFGILAVAYFLVHSVQGDRGILAWLAIHQQIQRAEVTLAAAVHERERLEARVSLMRNDGLDRDMLDEQVRRVLGLVGPGEIIVFEPVVEAKP
jgi:cell division protein FtsB